MALVVEVVRVPVVVLDGHAAHPGLHETARETGSVDLDGRDLVYDLPNSGTGTDLFAETVVISVRTFGS